MTSPRTLSPAVARVKRAVRKAVGLIGGIDGAAATVDRGRSTVHRWASLNDPDMPCIDSVMAIDEVLMATGHGPMVMSALAAELGYVTYALNGVGDMSITALTSKQAIEYGQFMAEITTGLADGTFTPEEKTRALSELDDVLAVQMRLRAALAEGVA
jgi:hypothetical protein